MLLKFIQDAYTSPVHLTKVSNTSTCPLSRVPSPFFVLEVQFFWQSIFMCGFINWRTDYVERSVVCIAFQSLNCSVKPPSRGSPNSPQRMCPLPSSVYSTTECPAACMTAKCYEVHLHYPGNRPHNFPTPMNVSPRPKGLPFFHCCHRRFIIVIY